MAFAAVNDPVGSAMPDIAPKAPDDAPKLTYRSYKKKFLKLKHSFDRTIVDSNNLCEEEQTLKRQAQELQESNDQILDLLLQINDEYSRLPSRYRFDISSPTPEASEVPPLDPDQPNSQLKLASANKIDFSKGYVDKLPRSLKALSILPHTTLESCIAENLLPSDLDSDDPTGYYSPSHEATYLAQLDSSLGLSYIGGPPQPASTRNPDKEKERQKQHELENPVSAYNWLRKNQPQVFLQDHEDGPSPAARLAKDRTSAAKASPKPRASPKPPVAKGTKRARESAVKKEEQELVLDDDGTIIGGGGLEDSAPPMSSKGKRKRDRGDDDNAYRPKGGSSRAPKKKKQQRASVGDKERGSGTPVEK
ncbi:MAG: hypothetical protein Q9195_000301 [Heterodermia aff. obscurata]